MALTYVGANATAASNVTIAAHQVGDIILIFAYSNSSTTTPTKPTASGTVPAWVDIDNNAGADSNSLRSAYFVATATTETSGTWTGATGMGSIVLRGQDTSPIGGHAESGSTASNASTAPSVTLTATNGTSQVVEYCAHTSVTAWGSVPTGYTRRANSATAGCVLTKNSTTSDGSVTAAATTTAAGGYRGTTVEVIAVPAPPSPPTASAFFF